MMKNPICTRGLRLWVQGLLLLTLRWLQLKTGFDQETGLALRSFPGLVLAAAILLCGALELFLALGIPKTARTYLNCLEPVDQRHLAPLAAGSLLLCAGGVLLPGWGTLAIAAAVAELDALCSLASAAVKNNYCRPEVDEGGVIEIHDGRHPVVERMLSGSLFVPNDTYMGEREDRVAIITGPNMAGKSTYMRQVALITLMAQVGSFVPARAARIGVVDRIFTRIGASDDLGAGQSTFMVEMTEVADILKYATSRSLLILDEIGRGTSTFDGMSIARAVLEHCADKKKLGAKTLFATHYHELTALEGELPGVRNFNIAIKSRGEDLIFLRKIIPGGADRSYGIEVAKLAGLPEGLIRKARAILKDLESQSGHQTPLLAAPQTEQVSMAALGEAEVIDRLRRTQAETLTPLEALNLLYELKQKLN